MITRHDTYTQTRSFPVHFRWNFRQKINPKKFYCTKRLALKFEGESLELFLSYQVHFRRYQHFRPLWLKIAKNPRNCFNNCLKTKTSSKIQRSEMMDENTMVVCYWRLGMRVYRIGVCYISYVAYGSQSRLHMGQKKKSKTCSDEICSNTADFKVEKLENEYFEIDHSLYKSQYNCTIKTAKEVNTFSTYWSALSREVRYCTQESATNYNSFSNRKNCEENLDTSNCDTFLKTKICHILTHCYIR